MERLLALQGVHLDPHKIAAAVPAVHAVLEAFQDPAGARAALKQIPRFSEFADRVRALAGCTIGRCASKHAWKEKGRRGERTFEPT